MLPPKTAASYKKYDDAQRICRKVSTKADK